MNEEDLQKLHTNQKLLVRELAARGVDIKLFDLAEEIVIAKYKEHTEFLLDRDSSINPFPSTVISGNKLFVKKLLQNEKLSTPAGNGFYAEQMDDALDFAQKIGFPVVIKPSFGSHGDNVYLDIHDLNATKRAIEQIAQALRLHKLFIVEKQHEGKEYRIFITKDGHYAVLHREPAHVIGNGLQTVQQIADIENHTRTHQRQGSICPLLIDGISLDFLQRSAHDLSYIPKKGEKIYLRRNSNMATGGISIDLTDEIHPSLVNIALQALKIFPGMPYAGVDILSLDPFVEQTPDTYKILEVNSLPGLHMHMAPTVGKPRNVAKLLADLIFPETAGRGGV